MKHIHLLLKKKKKTDRKTAFDLSDIIEQSYL